MTEADVLSLFRRSGALLEGHFVLSSGLHSPGYLQCALVLSYPKEAAAIGAALADRCRAFGATIVLSPALGATVVGACAIVDRSGGNPGLDVPFQALLPMTVPAWPPDQCPLCAQGVDVVKPGSRTRVT